MPGRIDMVFSWLGRALQEAFAPQWLGVRCSRATFRRWPSDSWPGLLEWSRFQQAIPWEVGLL